MSGVVGADFRYFFSSFNIDGTPRTGLVDANFSVTVRNPANDASMAPPTVYEVGGGMYFFDIASAFSASNGEGQYGVSVQLTLVPKDSQSDVVTFRPDQGVGAYVGPRGPAIHVSALGTPGSVAHVNGTVRNPTTTWADALTLSAATGIGAIVVIDPIARITLAAPLTGKRVYCESLAQEFDLGSQVVTSCRFEGVWVVDGMAAGSSVELHRSILGSTPGGAPSSMPFSGVAFDCQLAGAIQAAAGAEFIRCDSVSSSVDAAAGVSIEGDSFTVRTWRGGLLRIGDMAGASAEVMISVGSGTVEVLPTCTAGTLLLSGEGFLVDGRDGILQTTLSDDRFFDHNQLESQIIKVLGFVGFNKVVETIERDARGNPSKQRTRIYNSGENANTNDPNVGLIFEMSRVLGEFSTVLVGGQQRDVMDVFKSLAQTDVLASAVFATSVSLTASAVRGAVASASFVVASSLTATALAGPAVPVDGGIKMPTLAGHYAAMGLPGPAYRYELDDASGSLVDAVGGLDYDLKFGTPKYQQPVAGFARLGVKTDPGGWYRAGFPSIETAGVSVASYAIIDTTFLNTFTGAARGLMLINNKLEVGVSPSYEAQLQFNGTIYPTGATYPTQSFGALIVWDKNAGTVTLYTPQAMVVGAYVASVSPNTFSNIGGGINILTFAKHDIWVGTDAEGMDKNTLAAYGWPLSY